MKSDDFDDFVLDMQNAIDKKDQEDFSAYALQLAENPFHYGTLDSSPHTYNCAWRGPCGDLMHIFLKIESNLITETSFEVEGCATSVMAGSQTLKMIDQKPVEDAINLNDSDVLNALGKFPPESHHCCTLAVTTLQKVLQIYIQKIDEK